MDDVRTISLAASGDHCASFLGLLSRTGPETPPDEERAPVTERRTQDMAAVPERTVVVYEPEPRRSRGLLVFTAVMVSLTAGVILGQTVAYEDSSVYAAARTEPVSAGYRTPAESPLPSQGTRATAPLGATHDRVLEVAGDAALLTVRSVDLGDRLFDVTTLDGSAVPRVASRNDGPRLELVQTGAPGRVGADIQLNSRVRWTLRLTGRTVEQDIDMSGGRLAGVELTGAARVVLRLPTPKGTIRVTLSGGTSELDVQAGVPVRVRLGKGADGTVTDGKTRNAVKAGTILTSTGWNDAANRYLITASARVNLLRVTATPHLPLSGPPRSAR
jgi:hypothetical protein